MTDDEHERLRRPIVIRVIDALEGQSSATIVMTLAWPIATVLQADRNRKKTLAGMVQLIENAWRDVAYTEDEQERKFPMARTPNNPRPKIGDTRVRGRYIDVGPGPYNGEVEECEPDDPRAEGWFIERFDGYRNAGGVRYEDWEKIGDYDNLEDAKSEYVIIIASKR